MYQVLLGVVLAVMFVVPSQLFASSVVDGLALSTSTITSYTNTARIEAGVSALAGNSAVMKAAQMKADRMAYNREFSHILSDGTTAWGLLSYFGYTYGAVAENLAVHFYQADDLHKAWMNSYVHRNNILNPLYTDIGVGIAKGVWQGYEGYFIVQIFAKPLYK